VVAFGKGAPNVIEFRVLGSLEAVDQDGPLALGAPKQRTLLAVLLLHRGEPVSTERLVDEIWGEQPPASAHKLVQGYVSSLRRVLGDGLLVTQGHGYALQIPPGQLDVDRFEILVTEGQRASSQGDAPTAAVRLRKALGLWRGPPLADFAYEPFAQAEIARLDEARLAAIELRFAVELAIGHHTQLVADLEALVREHPLREGFTAQLMLALYGSGRQAEALDVYQNARARLSEELGLEPGPELKALQTAILNQEPWLAEPTRGGARAPVQPPLADIASAAVPGAHEISSHGEHVIAPDRELSLAEPVGVRPVRKVVTVLSCDVTGSTELGKELDPEVLRGVMNRCSAELRATIDRHGGTADKFIGDAVVAVFGIPRVNEDDALRAVRAAAEIRDRLPAIAEEVGVALRFRTGVNTGLVLAGEGENLAIGDAVNVAARLEQCAQPGEILLGPETLDLVRDAVVAEPVEPLTLKGESRPTPAFRLLDIDRHAPGFARRFDVPLVGRARELRVLRDAWDRSVAEPGCHLFTLLGAAGVGKSRLVAELLAALGDEVSVLGGRCLHYGEGITFWPLQEALAGVGKPAEPVLDRLGGGGTAAPEELFFEVRRLLESLAAEMPLIVHVDDLQWAEPMLLDLLDHIVELSRGAPILVLCVARPELLEDRPGWGGGKLNATSLLLEPLTTSECQLLLSSLGDGLDHDTRDRVVAASEGNPLFLEEMAALAAATGTTAVPATIQAVLAARLESLGNEEREVLDRGAIEGEVFHRLAVRALLGERTETELNSRLAGLVRKELIRPHPATIRGDDAFRFRHLLIRDAAYDAVPKATLADLHESFARWLEQSGAALPEPDEIIGWHLEQTLRYRHELGQDAGRALPRGAAEHLHTAGRRALDRRDVPAAKNLLERALALAEGDSRRARIAADLADGLFEAGEFAPADELLKEIENDPDVSALAALTRFEWMTSVGGPDTARTIESRLPGLLEHFARVADERGLARAHLVAHYPHWMKCHATAAGDELRLAAEHARNAGDDGLRQRALALYVITLQNGQADPRTIAQALDTIEREKPGPYLAASVDGVRGELARLDGRFGEARRLAQQASERFRLLGLPEMEAGREIRRGVLELSAGDPEAAIAALQRSDAIFAQMGANGYRSTAQAFLAQAYSRLGNNAAATAAIELSEEFGSTDDILNLIITHQARARLALAEGEGEAAQSWARSAVEYASRTDDLNHRANAKLDLARVLAALERPEAAIPEARAALDLFLTKGDRPGGDQTRALLDDLGARQ
jgi:class 3 adenylate cyclase/DNA-binding SARP family transcriptional activator